HNHAEDLEHNTRVVDDRHEPDAEDVQRGGADQRDHRDGDLSAGVVRQVDPDVQAVQQGNDHDRDGHVHRANGEHAGKQVDPAGEPGEVLAGQVLGPLVDRSGDGEVRAELGEIEADDQLPDDDDRPAQEEGRAGQAETAEIT